MNQTLAYRIYFKHTKEDGETLWIKMIENEDPAFISLHVNQLRVDNPSKTYKMTEIQTTEKDLES